MVTSVGKILFNNIMPKDYTYINEPTDDNLQNGVPDKYFLAKGQDIHEYLANAPLVPPFKKGFLSDIIAEVYKRYKVTITSELLDKMKDLGYFESTISGLTVGVADITDLKEKPGIIEEAHKQVALVTKQFRRGLITDNERYERVIAIWNDAKDEVQEKLIEHMDIHNPINMMSDQGTGNILTLPNWPMRGLMASIRKIMNCQSCPTSGKGCLSWKCLFPLTKPRKDDKHSLKTANSGYLTSSWLTWPKT